MQEWQNRITFVESSGTGPGRPRKGKSRKRKRVEREGAERVVLTRELPVYCHAPSATAAVIPVVPKPLEISAGEQKREKKKKKKKGTSIK
jgi:hypothetical protein